MFCGDTIKNDRVEDPENKGWKKSLVRNTTNTALKFLRKIQDNEMAEEDLGSAVSKTAFFQEVAEVMMKARRSCADTNDGIVWETHRSRRHGFQFQDGAWTIRAARINIVGRLVPAAPVVVAPPAQSRIVDNPMICLADLTNEFPTKWRKGNKNLLRALTLRLMAFHKKRIGPQAQEGKQKKFYVSTCADSYKLCDEPEIHLRDFFFSKAQVTDWLKNTYNRSGTLLDPERRINGTGNQWMWDFAVLDQDNWDIRGSETQVGDYSQDEETKDALEELEWTLEQDEGDLQTIENAHAIVARTKVYSYNYIRACRDRFLEYRNSIVSDFAENPGTAAQRYKKKRKTR